MDTCKIYITTDLGFGDSGKGAMSDYLVTKHHATAIVRYTGGPHAAHHVVTAEGRAHGFCQFGSTFDRQTHTHLAQNFIVKPQNLLSEERMLNQQGLSGAFTRLSIDPRCSIVTPFHAMIGQMLEISRGDKRFGSVGMGVGQALLDRRTQGENALRICDAFDEKTLTHKLHLHYQEKISQAKEIIAQHDNPELSQLFQHFIKEVPLDRLVKTYQFFTHRLPVRFIPDEDMISEFMEKHESIIFEGAHGSLIDFQYGFWPYVTKTDTTIKPAESLLARSRWASPSKWRPSHTPHNNIDITRIGIIRAYNYRHGAGPFVTENEILKELLPLETHNVCNEWQGETRVGWFDLLSLRYGICVNSTIDWLALTMLDKLAGLKEFKVCISYEYIGDKTDLNLLDTYFEWGYAGTHRIRVTGLKAVKNNQSDQFARLLFDCRPFEFLEFTGKPADISRAKSLKDFPDHILAFMRFLESSQGLNLPIRICSVGPTACDKISNTPI